MGPQVCWPELRIDVPSRRKSFRRPAHRRAVHRTVHFPVTGIWVVAAAGYSERRVGGSAGKKTRSQCAKFPPPRANTPSRMARQSRKLTLIFGAPAVGFFTRS